MFYIQRPECVNTFCTYEFYVTFNFEWFHTLCAETDDYSRYSSPFFWSIAIIFDEDSKNVTLVCLS